MIELVQAQMLVLNQASPRLWPGLRLELALVFSRQGPGCRRWRSTGLQPGKALAMVTDSTRQALAVGGSDRAGAGADAGANQGKPWPWVQVLN